MTIFMALNAAFIYAVYKRITIIIIIIINTIYHKDQ